jgi:hypothetical protein
MERGPMALFGAIVAVGLGPAMWLGAQFGESTSTPLRPPAVTVQQNSTAEPRGGSGAGDAPVDQTQVIRTEPKARTETVRTGPRNKPPATSPAPSPSASDEPSTDPAKSTPPTESGSQQPSTPPVEEPTDPGTPPAEESTEPATPTDPPATDLDTEQLAGASRA